jgi:hypothetical protein
MFFKTLPKRTRKMLFNIRELSVFRYSGCFAALEHFPLRQKMTLAIKIYCSRLYITKQQIQFNNKCTSFFINAKSCPNTIFS